MLMNADEDDDAKYDPEEEEVNSWEKSILKQTISTSKGLSREFNETSVNKISFITYVNNNKYKYF